MQSALFRRAGNSVSYFNRNIAVRHISNTCLQSAEAVQKLKTAPKKTIIKENKFKAVKMSEFIYPTNTPVVFLDCVKAFDALSPNEKFYAHYISKASQYGGLIVLLQVSQESPLIYVLLMRMFRSQSLEELKKVALSQCGFTEEEFTNFLIYAGAFFHNMGNYKGFGDVKFIPNLPKEKFRKLVLASQAAALNPEKIQSLLNRCEEKIYSIAEGEQYLGFGDVGVTKYLTKNFTKEDGDIVSSFLKKMNFEAYNHRVIKSKDESGQITYELKLASILTSDDSSDQSELFGIHTMDGHKFVVTRGDYRPLLNHVCEHMASASKYGANSNQVTMLEQYCQSFRTGSMSAHKDGSRYWIKDKGPIIESYIGFIESYRDPAGMRGEFEGFAAMVNKPMSEKFSRLVESAEKFLPLLPWPSAFEKDKFLLPDFTSLDVLTFSGSSVPAGINIPNYDDVKQNEGFKNVSLGNVITASFKATTPNYLSQADREMFDKHKINAYEVQVGLHELLGHGSGKLFRRRKDGTFNFDAGSVVNYGTNEKITSWYEEGETYDTQFSSMGSALEECRAECVGLHLCIYPEILKVFGFSGQEADDVMYTNWVSECHSGLESLQMYDPKSKQWKQAHSQARFGILQVVIEAGEGFATIQEKIGEDGKPDLLLTLDRSKIKSVGHPALAKFLGKIQLYKSTADVQSAKEMFDKYTAVTHEGSYPFLKYRDIIMARKKPRRIIVQANTSIQGNDVVLKTYSDSPEGMIQSWVERFSDHDEIDDILENLWQQDEPHFS